MQFDYFVNKVKKLEEVKNDLDSLAVKLSDGDDLFLQHMNAELDNLISVLMIKANNEREKLNEKM